MNKLINIAGEKRMLYLYFGSNKSIELIEFVKWYDMNYLGYSIYSSAHHVATRTGYHPCSQKLPMIVLEQCLDNGPRLIETFPSVLGFIIVTMNNFYMLNVCVRVRVRMRMRVHRHTRTRTHTHTRARTRADTRTHTHARTWMLSRYLNPPVLILNIPSSSGTCPAYQQGSNKYPT